MKASLFFSKIIWWRIDFPIYIEKSKQDEMTRLWAFGSNIFFSAGIEEKQQSLHTVYYERNENFGAFIVNIIYCNVAQPQMCGGGGEGRRRVVAEQQGRKEEEEEKERKKHIVYILYRV